MTIKITRRLFAAGLILAAPGVSLAAGLSPDDQALVDKAVAYLQNLTVAKGRFTQTDQRGKRASGDIYLQRPGKVRFEYDPPNKVLIISDGNQVAIQDDRLGTFERYPLRATPLNLFLGREIRLDRGVIVTDVARGDGKFVLTARDGGGEADGRIILTFADEPIALKEWTVIDGQNQRTRIELNSLTRVGSLPASLFHFDVPRKPGSRRP